ncbi:MAG: C1 family peptidase [Synergistales bacterium]|nr:C1 family peptidase [Synergistales bacterium]
MSQRLCIKVILLSLSVCVLSWISPVGSVVWASGSYPQGGPVFKGWTLASEENFPFIDLSRHHYYGLEPTPGEIIEQMGMKGNMISLTSSAYVPGEADIRGHMPPVSKQSYNECSTFSLAYYCVSYWKSLYEGVGRGWGDDELGSSLFLYNQCNGGYDRAIYLALPYRLTSLHGCSFIEDFDPRDLAVLPGIAEEKKALWNMVEDQGYLYYSRNYEEPVGYDAGNDKVTAEEIKAVKYCLSNNIPVVVGIFLYEPFIAGTGLSTSSVYYGPDKPYPDPVGYHAVTITGYKNDSTLPGGGAFSIRNSWGSEWGADGDCWLSYAFIQDHSSEAYPVKIRKGYYPDYYIVVLAHHPRRGDLELLVDIDGGSELSYNPHLMAPDDERDDLKAILDVTDWISPATYSITLKVINHSTTEEGIIEEAYLVRSGTLLSGGSSPSDPAILKEQEESAVPFDFGSDYVVSNQGSSEGTIILPYSDFTEIEIIDPDPPSPSIPDGSGGSTGGCNITLHYLPLLIFVIPLMAMMASKR